MPYSRAELLNAIRTDHPELRNIEDNKLFAAIAQDHPELAQGISELHQPAYQSPKYPAGPESRTAGQVASDQAANVLKGMPSAVTAVPGTVATLAKMGWKGATGNVSGMTDDLVAAGKGLAHGIADPVVPLIKTAAGLAPPPESPEWEEAAKGVGANLAGLELPNAAAGAGVLARTGVTAARDAMPGGSVGGAVKAFMDRPREPVSGMTKALKPLATNIAFKEAASRALPYLKQAERALGKPIESVEDLLAAGKIAKQGIWRQYDAIKGPQAARGIDGSPVADAIEKSISLKTKIQSPAAAQKLSELADTYRRHFTIAELDDLLTTSNAELEAYHGKYPAARTKAVTANPDIAQNVAEANSLRNLIYDQLDSNGASRELKKDYGSLMNVEKEAQRRLNVAARQNPDSLSEQVSKWTAASQLARSGVKAGGLVLTGRPLRAVGELATGAGYAYTAAKVASTIKELNSSNSIIANVFRNYDRLPPSRTPALRTPAGLLGPGPIVTPPPADPSYARGVPAQPAVSGTPRMLPPARTPITPAAPADTSYVRGVPAQFAQRPVRGLLPRGPVITPPPADASAVTAIPAKLGAPALDEFPKSVPYQKFGAALKQAGVEATMKEMTAARMAQIKDVARSGATEFTGKGIREFNFETGESGKVVGRGGGTNAKRQRGEEGGTKLMFKELKGFSESPSEIAAAIERGKGKLFTRIEKAVRDALPETPAQPSDIDFGFGANISSYRANAWEALRNQFGLNKKP